MNTFRSIDLFLGSCIIWVDIETPMDLLKPAIGAFCSATFYRNKWN